MLTYADESLSNWLVTCQGTRLKPASAGHNREGKQADEQDKKDAHHGVGSVDESLWQNADGC